MHIIYHIQIEKVTDKWVGMLHRVVNYNIEPSGSIVCEKELIADSYMELYMLMFEEGFFRKLGDNPIVV